MYIVYLKLFDCQQLNKNELLEINLLSYALVENQDVCTVSNHSDTKAHFTMLLLAHTVIGQKSHNSFTVCVTGLVYTFHYIVCQQNHLLRCYLACVETILLNKTDKNRLTLHFYLKLIL